MPKGYVYIMTSAIDGLIKIGKSKDWNRRCKDELESNGYKNINALRTYYVVECEDYDEIESIMHDIFRESRVSNIEAFAIDKDRAKRVLSKMGTQVFPEVSITTANNFTSRQSLETKLLNFKYLGLNIGDKLVCDRNKTTLTVTVADDTNKVKLPDNSIVDITTAEKIVNPRATNGFKAFRYNSNHTLYYFWTKKLKEQHLI